MAVADMLASSLQSRAAKKPYNPVTDPQTLSPLPTVLRKGLPAVIFFAFLSFLLSLALFARLSYRFIKYRDRKLHRNQFLILILNLLFADIQQSTSFLIGIRWLQDGAITVGTPACFAQAFFISNGDVASGIFTMAIGLHTFVDIVFNWQPSYRVFLASIASCHTFVYFCSIIGLIMHPKDYYRRAGTWCWVNPAYQTDRLWLHYFWILLAEFGTVILYTVLFVILRRRLTNGYYATTAGGEARAKAAMWSLIPYPIIYVVCTCPLAATRLSSMAGRTPTFPQLVIAGLMITSNGWLDVLLYSLTRRALIFGRELPSAEMRALDTFYYNPAGSHLFGTVTTISAGAEHHQLDSKEPVVVSGGLPNSRATSRLGSSGGPKSASWFNRASRAFLLRPNSTSTSPSLRNHYGHGSVSSTRSASGNRSFNDRDSDEELMSYSSNATDLASRRQRFLNLGASGQEGGAAAAGNNDSSRLKVKTEVQISSVPLAVAELEASREREARSAQHSPGFPRASSAGGPRSPRFGVFRHHLSSPSPHGPEDDGRSVRSHRSFLD